MTILGMVDDHLEDPLKLGYFIVDGGGPSLGWLVTILGKAVDHLWDGW